jgi:FHA domain
MGAMSDIAQARASAARVAKWLVEKGRPDDAVSLLAAWAAAGPNDSEGQQLLAEALRVDPSARVAQQAFERMEGVPGEHGDLDAAIARYEAGELGRLETEMSRPTFRRAQMGFNNNIKFKERVFHVQTEDSGLDQPHVITQLFADGGRVIKGHKRDYHDHVSRPDVAEYVRTLMKAQHLEMVLLLREGRFDPVIEGREIGGMTLLTEPPAVENIKKLASKKEARAQAGQAAVAEASPESRAVAVEARAGSQTAPSVAPPVPRPAPSPTEQQYFRLHVLRSLWGGPERFDPRGAEAVIGRNADIALSGEVFCHSKEAALAYKEGQLWLEDLGHGNGVFLRIRTPVELDYGAEFVVGDQLLRVEKNPVADDGPDPEPTYFYSSPKWPSSFRIVQVFVGGALGATVVSRGTTLQVGSAIGDLVFPDDPLVSPQHCLVEEQAGSVFLTDLGSRTGVFVRIRGTQELQHSDELLVGRTRLVIDLSPASAR